MDDLLALAQGFPRRSVDADEVLLVAAVTDPGACVGEMSLLLGVAATADVGSERDPNLEY